MSSLAEEARAALRELRGEPAAFTARFELPGSAAVLPGHFPGQPVVPGVYLIEAAWSAARALEPGLGALRAVEQAKFLRPLEPGQAAELRGRLEPDPAGPRVQVEFWLGAERAATLTLRGATASA